MNALLIPVMAWVWLSCLGTLHGDLASIVNLHAVGYSGSHRYNTQDQALSTRSLVALHVAGVAHHLWVVHPSDPIARRGCFGQTRGDRSAALVELPQQN